MIRETFLAAALLLGARAVEPAPAALSIAEPRVPHSAAEEHELMPVEGGGPTLDVDEEIHPMPEWSWPREHLERGRGFADPFIGPEVYPELSAGIQIRAAVDSSRRVALYDQQVALGLYLVEIRFPLIASRAGSACANQVLLDAKIPLSLGKRHRFAFVWGVAIPDGAPALTRNSRGEVLYTFSGRGGRALTLQVKLGYGYEQLFVGEPLRQAGLFGALAGLRIGHFQPVVQVEGAMDLWARENRVALAPGLWVFPQSRDTVQLGASALVVLNGGQRSTPGRLGAITRSAGVIASLSYNFL
jgi:hypothetical protein